MTIPPYDDVERRFLHTDAYTDHGLAMVEDLLCLPKRPVIENAQYDLSFYSGGIGVLDRHAITLRYSPDDLARCMRMLDVVPYQTALAEDDWREELLWLLRWDDESIAAQDAARIFIDREKRSFQSQCDLSSDVLFGRGSNVNDWTVLWKHAGLLNFLAYSQG